MDRHELAWAAGFFDGEGWAAKNKTRGVQSRINQAGPNGMPAVLIKFQRALGVGRLKGPHIEEGRQDLYWWEVTSRPDVERVADLIAPWLCPAKRAEFERALGRSLVPAIWPSSASEERAWAGGLFDGEGCTYLEKHRTHAGYFVPRLDVPQASEVGIAPELLRLRAALGDIGTLSGVRRGKSNRKPYRRWRVFTPRGRATRPASALALYRRREAIAGTAGDAGDPCTARPATRQSRVRRCGSALLPKRDDKWNARVRPFKGRGRNQEDPSIHLRQCLECVRIDARARRARGETKDRQRKRRRSAVT